MKSTLLFGNGLNRLQNNDLSWQQLIQEQAGLSGSAGKEVPLPILAEISAAKKSNVIGMRRSDTYKELQNEIKVLIEKADLQPTAIHSKLRSLPFDYFVTTNYDDCFERSKPEYKQIFKYRGGYRYLLNMLGTVENRPIFHAHGHFKWASTICVSYEQYMGLIGRIHGQLFLKQEEDDEYLEQLKRMVLNDSEIQVWPELFFKTNVQIVGLGLDFAENDLWWLLSLRSALFNKKKELHDRENTITFYSIKVESKDAEKDAQEDVKFSAKEAALESLGVVVEFVFAEDYLVGYEKIIGDIQEQLEKNYE